MSGVWAYCVTSMVDGAGPELAGIDEEPVFLHSSPSLTLWLSTAHTAPEPTLAAVRRHGEVVDVAWRSADACVPFRYGQWFESTGAAEAALAEREEAMVAALGRVGGTAEFGVRVLDPAEAGSDAAPEAAPPSGVTGAGPAPDAPGGRGRAYMEELRRRTAGAAERQRRGEGIRREVLDALGDVVIDERSSAPTTSHTVVELAHLVRRGEEERYRKIVEGIRSSRPDVRFLVSGPWPPWSFGP